MRLERAADLGDAWRALGRPRAVLEAFVPFRQEVSVVGVRGLDGAIALYAPFSNQHAHHVLDVSVSARTVAPSTGAAALEIARTVFEGLEGRRAVRRAVRVRPTGASSSTSWPLVPTTPAT